MISGKMVRKLVSRVARTAPIARPKKAFPPPATGKQPIVRRKRTGP